MKALAIFLVLFASGIALGQTAVTATLTDSDSQTWNNGTWTASLISPVGKPNGCTTAFTVSGTMSGSGVLTGSLCDNSLISPTGSLWQFTLCPNASSGCSVVSTAVSGATQNLSSVLSAGLTAPRFPALFGSHGYLDIEVTPIPQPGATYYNVTTPACRQWTGSAWVNCGGGGGGTGTVTSVSSNNLSPLFNVSISNPTVNPAFTFAAIAQAANTVFGNFTGFPNNPGFSASPVFSAANLTNFPFSISGLTANCVPKAATATTITGCSSASDNGTVFLVTEQVSAGSSGNLQLGSDPGGASYSSLTFNGTLVDSAKIGILGGGTGDPNLFYDVPTTGAHEFRVAGGIVGTISASSLTYGASFSVSSAAAVLGASFNGVALTTGGSSTTFLNGAGGYTTPAGGGTGTVTHTAGPLTALALVIGNGSADVKVDTGASTDGAGNMTAVSYTASGTTQGFDTYGVGTGTITTTLPTNYVGIIGPPTGTPAYFLQLPSASPTGQVMSCATPGSVNGVNQSVCTWTSGAGISFPQTVAGTTTSGGIPYFSSTTVLTSSAILNTNVLIKGGGAGGAPTNSSITDNATTVTSTDTGGFVGPLFTSNGTTAGFTALSQGTTSAAVGACANANTWCTQAPTSVTSTLEILPSVGATGFWFGTLSGSTLTDSFVASNGTGNVVLTTSPTLVTPVLGVATATSINKVTITAPATSATLTLVTGSSLITAGAFATTLTATATTNSTLPSGTHSLAPLDSPTFTATPAAPTAAAGTNTTQLATTAFAKLVNNSSETVASSATPTFSVNTGTSYNVLTANVTSFTLAAGIDGQLKTLCFKQGLGPFTVAAPANVHGFFTVGVTNADYSCQSFVYNLTNSIWLATSTGVVNM